MKPQHFIGIVGALCIFGIVFIIQNKWKMESSKSALVNKLNEIRDTTNEQQIISDIDKILATDFDSLESLSLQLESPTTEQNLRLSICWFLGRYENQTAVSTLIKVLRDSDPMVRAEAAKSLGTLGSRQAVMPLLRTLEQDEDSEVRKSAIYALGIIGDLKAFDAIVQKLNDPNEQVDVRGMAAESLSDFRDEFAVPPLIQALSDESPEIRYWAVYALGQLQDKKAIPFLQEIITKDHSTLTEWGTIKKEAIEAIENIRSANNFNNE